MEEIRGVRKYLKEIFREIKQELQEDEFIRSLVGSPENLSHLIKQQEKLISDYMDSWEQGAVDFSKRFEELYSSVNVPYTVVAWNIDRIKSKIMEKLIEENYSRDFVLKMKDYLETLTNQIAKIFLRKDVRTLSNFKSSSFSDRLLYAVHRQWLDEMVKCVEEDDFSSFPLISASECKFSEVLEYPESLFVCLDANMCSYVHDIHKLIHNTANTFYVFYTKGAYYQAYRVFKDMVELIAKLFKTLSELYFLAYSDQESNFFRLAHGLSLQDSYKYVSMIDVVGLKEINRNYGEKVGDEVVREVERRLRNIVKDDPKRSLLIKGSTADFFMLNMDISEEEIRALMNRISEELHFNIKVNGKDIAVLVTVSTLEIEPFVELPEADLRDILYFLKEEAKRSTSHTSVSIGKEKRQEILNWINEKYRNVEKVKSKIENGEIELVFHPIVDAANINKLVGAEVLVRLKDGKKLIPAGVFIDLIYELNLVEKLDRAVLGKLEEYGDMLRGLVNNLFINVSARSLNSKAYVERLCSFISGMKDFSISLELTEQQLLENKDVVVRVSHHSHVSIAVDDFGTGYSSLKLVADLTDRGLLKFLKVDGSLVRDVLKSHAIWKVVDIISTLSKRLELRTVAEFIESSEELTVVKSMGIDYCQGYYIAKPMTIEELLVWVKSLG